MSKGKRYNADGRKLNMKKVFGLFAIIILILLFVIVIKNIIKADKEVMAGKNIELAYFPVFSNGNWGIINSSGNTVVEPAYAEMIMIPNKSKPVFICTYDVNYADGTYKTKAINEKNEEILTEYENINTIQNRDKNNNFWYEDSVLKAQKNGKYGLINLEGSVLVNFEYDSINALQNAHNSILLKKDGKMGLVNASGKPVIPAEYTDITMLTDNYADGYIVKNAENKFGIISTSGEKILDCIYDEIKQTTDSGMYIVKANNEWKVCMKDGVSYLEGKIDNAVSINAGNVIVNNNGKYGIYNIEKNLIVPTEYDYLEYAFEDKYIAKQDGKFGIINTNKEVLVAFNYQNIEFNKKTEYFKASKSASEFDYISKSLEVKVTSGTEKFIKNAFISLNVDGKIKYYNYELEEKSNKEVFQGNTLFVTIKDGRYGFSDKSGKTVVECIYENATEQNDYGFSGIKANGKWGVIDQYGHIVIEPTYVLKDENINGFIGKWYAGADLNANFYTDLK